MKTIIRALCAILIIALAAALFAACGTAEKPDATAPASDSAPAPDGTTGGTADGTAEAGTTAADTTAGTTAADDYVNPLTGYRTIPTELEVGNEDEGLTIREYKFLVANVYVDEAGNSYNWYEFYNACVTGTVRLTEKDLVPYVESCMEFFEEANMEDEYAEGIIIMNGAMSFEDQ